MPPNTLLHPSAARFLSISATGVDTIRQHQMSNSGKDDRSSRAGSTCYSSVHTTSFTHYSLISQSYYTYLPSNLVLCMCSIDAADEIAQRKTNYPPTSTLSHAPTSCPPSLSTSSFHYRILCTEIRPNSIFQSVLERYPAKTDFDGQGLPKPRTTKTCECVLMSV